MVNQHSFDDDPIAFFLTWTTYGTWLPGDHRGWNRKGATDNLSLNPLLQESAYASMQERPFYLEPSDRSLTKNIISKHCVFRNWTLHAVNVRTNHVHVVVTAANNKPQTVTAQFKAWATRELKTAHPSRKRFWSQGASCRWLNLDSELDAAVEYTIEGQVRKM